MRRDWKHRTAADAGKLAKVLLGNVRVAEKKLPGGEIGSCTDFYFYFAGVTELKGTIVKLYFFSYFIEYYNIIFFNYFPCNLKYLTNITISFYNQLFM